MEQGQQGARASESSRPMSASEVRHKLPAPPSLPAEARELMASLGATHPAQEESSEPSEHSRVMERAQDRVSFPSLPPSVAKIGRYEVLGRIAVGGMAEIYLGRETVQTGTLRHTALKLLRRQSSNESDERYFEELFLREGRTASQLVHPNICHVYEFGKWQGDFFIAMEFIDGVALRDVLAQMERKRVRMSPVLASGIAAQVAGALEYAHNARDARRRPLGVVHLDVTPQNIMLRHDGSVKLLDFGVAQVIEPQADSRSDTVKGKTGYMAPEQVLQKPLDARVDVFCLGICLYEMLSGTRLFKRDNLKASLVALLKEPVPSLCSLRADVPPELDAIVQKALALDVESRFQSAGELQAALEGFVARSRQVVSNRHVATLMEQLFPEARFQAPTLYTGPDVLARLASVEPAAMESGQQSPHTVNEPPLADGTDGALRPAAVLTGSGIVVRSPYLQRVALACLVLALGVGAWWSTREATVLTSAPLSQARTGSGSEQARGPATPPSTPLQAPAPTLPALTVPSQAQAPEPAPVEAEDTVVAEPAPIAAPPPAPAQGAASKNTAPRPNKRRSPGFVADPGF